MKKFNKKASEDVIFIVIMLFFAAIFFLMVYLVNSSITAAAIPAFEGVSAGSGVAMTSVNSIFDNTIDYVFLAAFFGLIISLIITSFLTPTHPIFFILDIVLFIALIIVSVVLSNIYESVSTMPTFAAGVSHMPIMNYLLLNLPLISIVIGIIGAIIIYSRTGNPINSGGVQQTQ